MSNYNELVNRYIAAWNETDEAQRKALIVKTYTESATCRDPKLEGDGHGGIDTMIGTVQGQLPGHKFTLTTGVEAVENRVRFSWSLAAEGERPFVTGTDFATVAADGRLESVTGFFDQV